MMIEALLHGKLSREQENMEDLLTSNVFGLLQYAPPDAGLFPFLALAQTIDGQCPLAGLTAWHAASVEYAFWPRWQECELDVLLRVRNDDGQSLLIGIEAKYRSGKSSEAEEAEERPNDQLAREWVGLSRESRNGRDRPILVYLTADVTCPKPEIRASLESLTEQPCPSLSRSAPEILWLSWRHLPGLFRGHRERLLAAVGRLAEKMELMFFEGIKPIFSTCPDWVFQAPSLPWRFQVEPIGCDWLFEGLGADWTFGVDSVSCHWRFRP